MPINAKVVISSGNWDIALRVFSAMRDDLAKQFGKEAIYFAKIHPKPIQKEGDKFPNYYADFLLDIPKET